MLVLVVLAVLVFHLILKRVIFRPVRALTAVAERTGRSMAQLALAWAMHRPGVTSVLVGGRTPAHLDQAFTALAFNEPALFAELEAD